MGSRDLEYWDSGATDILGRGQQEFAAEIACCLTNIYALCPTTSLGKQGAQPPLQTYAKVVARVWGKLFNRRFLSHEASFPSPLPLSSCLAVMAGAAAAILRQWRKEQANCRDLIPDHLELLYQQQKLPPLIISLGQKNRPCVFMSL